MNLEEALNRHPLIQIRQRRELAELFGFETRNKYGIESAGGESLGFAAEQQKGVLGFLFRQWFGHWRNFDIHFFNPDRSLAWRAVHPFRWFFSRLEVIRPDGSRVGAIQRRWALLSKRFEVEDDGGVVVMEVSSPIWRPWTFLFKRHGREVGAIRKKWAGLLQEAFTDADRFHVEFASPDLELNEKVLLVSAGIFVDLQYFEEKAR